MENINLVTGANGHLGNNIIRALTARGEKVRGSVRNIDNKTPFIGLNCEIVYADIMDKSSLLKAMDAVHTVYHCAAIYKNWAPDPYSEIIEPNLIGTKNVLESAAKKNVQRLVYVSSMAALDYSTTPMNEAGWNDHCLIPYYEAKTKAEKLAWNIQKESNINMLTVLPGGMIGPNLFDHLTPTMSFLNNILHNQLPGNPCFHFNFVDVRDVASGIIDAAKKGHEGERYILGNKDYVSSTRVFEIAHSIFPDVKIPEPTPRQIMLQIGKSMEEASIKNGQPPALTTAFIETYYKADLRLDTSKAVKELGFNPKDGETAVEEALVYLKENFS